MSTPTMTGAELQTLRESCGLSREDLATLAGVQARTLKHWEHGRSGVPADVGELVQRIESTIAQAVQQAGAALQDAQTAAQGAAPRDVVLIRYQSSADLARYRPDMAGLPAGVQGAIVARVRHLAQALPGWSGVPVRIVWMMPEHYEPWRAACQQPDTEATRSLWAAQQVQAQAQPHRGDQLPHL